MDSPTARRLNLIRLAEERGGQAELARALGKNASHLSQIIRGHRDMGTKFARFVELQLGLEMGSMDWPPADAGQRKPFLKASVVRVPVLTPAQAVTFEQHLEKFREGGDMEVAGVDPDLAKEVSDQTFALHVQGEAMLAPGGLGLADGDLVVIDPRWSVEPGCWVAAHLDGQDEVVVRKYRPKDHAGQKFALIPLNEDYPEIVTGRNECLVIGRVVEQRRRLT